MKRIFKSILTLAAAFFISKSEAKISEVNNRVVKIRAALIQQVEESENTEPNELITYFQTKHGLDNIINSSLGLNNWNNWLKSNWNNWLKSTWNNWSNYSSPNWNNWLKSNWNNWSKSTWNNWMKF
jgi:hypothetical protein